MGLEQNRLTSKQIYTPETVLHVKQVGQTAVGRKVYQSAVSTRKVIIRQPHRSLHKLSRRMDTS